VAAGTLTGDNDTLRGGAGADYRVQGDFLNGDAGNDELRGGDDEVHGGPGADNLFGDGASRGTGKDTIHLGADRLRGGADNDRGLSLCHKAVRYTRAMPPPPEITAATPSFSRFCGLLLRKAPTAAIAAADNVLLALAIGIAGLALFNRPLARAVSSWEGFSPWFAAVPFVLLFVYGLLKANYEAFVTIAEREQATRDQLADAGKRRAVKSLLGGLSERGKILLALGEHLQASSLHEWDAQTCDLVRRSMGDGERARLDWGGVPTGVRFKPVTGLSSHVLG
jgi:Ca2+-binding RTX toxin-like protein